ncbi:MAG: lysophospholipase [Candidatus Omnitrophica bacterium]|nr:lysophospholipase [Candidatus Omnitrophota bacterium]MDD5487762.1 lysophospholipase [Candidatus Omnitrophota bacterium]
MRHIEENKSAGIMYRKWLAPIPEAVALLVHGMGAHTGRWEAFGEYFRGEGISSYALELRGFGATPPPKGHVRSFRVYLDDIDPLMDIISAEAAGKDVFIVGESMGALIAMLKVMEHRRAFSGLVCMSPAFKDIMHVPLSMYMAIFAALAYNPEKTFRMPFDSHMCTRDERYRTAMDEDHLETRHASARLCFELLKAQIKCVREAGSLELPVMFLSAGQDKLVDTKVIGEVFKRVKSGKKTLLAYPGMYHSLSIDNGREQVFRDIREWMRSVTRSDGMERG